MTTRRITPPIATIQGDPAKQNKPPHQQTSNKVNSNNLYIYIKNLLKEKFYRFFK